MVYMMLMIFLHNSSTFLIDFVIICHRDYSFCIHFVSVARNQSRN